MVETFFNHPKNPWRYPEEHPEWRPPEATAQDARERAWLDFKAEIEADYSYPLPFGFEQTWVRAWDARGLEDEQRIAALVAAWRKFEAAARTTMGAQGAGEMWQHDIDFIEACRRELRALDKPSHLCYNE